MSGGNKNSKRESKVVVPNVTQVIGAKLRSKRISLKYSLSDVAELVGVSIATINDIESGITVNIHYYIAYAQTLVFVLTELFDIKIDYSPRFDLNSKKQARLFLTDNIKRLYSDLDFFSEPRLVNDVVLKLRELNLIKDVSPVLRSKISGVLSSLVENKLLVISETIGRKKRYLKLS
jgi:transcriptional regulator with XRE-family HTH domain